MAEILHFRISSGLKNIIGRELINDKYIAIFELVKNSYDAGAKYARIRFDNLGTSEATITISDDGKGMSKEDIIKKWLFVAYSEKRNPSYRDNIKRAVAGAKGVGRFSCDRLGEHVCLSSKTASERILHSISISWSDFEKNSLDNFTDINVQYEFSKQEDDTCGTSIIISNLREGWTRADLLSLKKALTQLVNPSATSSCNGVQREHNKKLNNGLPILHKVPPKRDYGRYFCIMAEKGGTSHGGLTEKLSPFFHAKKQEVNAYGR